jgi:hypothetical protein
VKRRKKEERSREIGTAANFVSSGGR